MLPEWISGRSIRLRTLHLGSTPLLHGPSEQQRNVQSIQVCEESTLLQPVIRLPHVFSFKENLWGFRNERRKRRRKGQG